MSKCKTIKYVLLQKERKLSEKSHTYIEYAYAPNMQDIKVSVCSQKQNLRVILRVSLEAMAQVTHRYTHSELDSYRWPFLEILPGPYYKV